MSLVNDMLVDLQRREAPKRTSLRGLRPVAVAPLRPSHRLPMVAASMLVIISAGAWGFASRNGLAASQSPLPEPLALKDATDTTLARRPAEFAEPPVTASTPAITVIAEQAAPNQDSPEQIAPEARVEIVEAGIAAAGIASAEIASAEIASAEIASAEIAEPTEPVMPDPVTVEAPLVDAPPASARVIKQPTTNTASRADVALHAGLEQLRVENFREAERQFRGTLELQPDHSDAWAYLYTALLQQKRPTAAEAVAVDGLEQARNPAPLAKLYANALAERGELARALEVLQAHRPSAGVDTQYDELLGSLLGSAGRHADAAAIYQDLLTADASRGEWWIGFAISQDALGNSIDARQAFERARQAPGISTTLADYASYRIQALRSQN